ncbi:MAG: hypothetical protein ABFC67_14580 [Mizugakiibacter sp.]|uniref:hypothetical protein n=1 Tax=Mizugakiibacter sp. TaxID=1972610 RepID=UPI0032113A25
MTALRVTTFQGLRPRTNPRLLGDTQAQEASNCDIGSGVLTPIKRPQLTYTPNKTLPALAVYKAIEGASSAWLTWPFDVDVVKIPLPAGVLGRWAWAGDGEPRWGKFADIVNGAGNNYPAQFYALGIPIPTGAPAVSSSGGVSATTELRYYVYTFFSQDGEESGPSPISAGVSGKIDDTWVISGMDAFPVSSDSAVAYFSTDTLVVSVGAASGTITGATNAGPIVITETAHGRVNGSRVNISGVGGNTAANNTYANPYWVITYIDANTYSLNGSAGNGAYTSGGSVRTVTPHWLRASDEVVLSSTTMAVASVPTAYTFNVTGNYSAATTWARKAPWNTTGMKRRLYRTAGTAAGFQLVNDNVGTSYNDTLLASAIMGDELISEGWEPAPAGLRGLIVTASGALAGFVGNTLRLSEPSQGHAWPSSYAYRTSPPIVGIATMGSAIGVGTTGVPHVAIGSDPSAMELVPTNIPYPCLSKRSIVSDGTGMLFASNVGLVRLDQSGQTSVFSEEWYDPTTWGALSPSTMVCAIGPRKLYVIYTVSGRAGMLAWDMVLGELVENAIEADDLYIDEATGDAYVSDASGISALIGGAYASQLVWRSKEFVLPKPINFGAAKVRFSATIDAATLASILSNISSLTAYNANIVSTGLIKGGFNWSGFNTRRWNGSLLKAVPDVPPSNTVTFTLFTDGVQRFSKTVSSETPFRLPSGYLSARVSVQVASACEINGIEIAETMQELETV